MNEIVYKEQVMYLLLKILEIAAYELKYSKSFESDYKKWLKFQKETDWKRYKASVDLLVDTDYALMSAFEFQLGYINSKHRDIGEMYLRLYGVLNAVYLQMGAYKSIANLLNYPDRKKVELDFEELNIYKLRNIAGSHTIDYEYPNNDSINEPGIKKKKTSFRIIQMHLDKTGRKIIALDENNLTFTYNLLETLKEYDKYSTNLLVSLIQHITKTIIKKKEDKESINERLNKLMLNLVDYSTLNKNSLN